jgi:hypothetical protein
MTSYIQTTEDFSNDDTQRFYESIMVQFDPVLTDVTESKGLTYRSYTIPRITIQEALHNTLNNKTLMDSLPLDIESILSPIHLDVLHTLIGSGFSTLKPRTALQIVSHLTLDKGTAAFADNIINYAETMYREARISDNPDRACLYRYLEEVRKVYEPDDDNHVFLDYSRIYNNTRFNHKIGISAFELERMTAMSIQLSPKDIEHYLMPGFDKDILPLIAADFKRQWEQDAYRPDSYDESIQLADRKTKLHRHLTKRIADNGLAEEIFQNITKQVEDYTVRSSTEMNQLISLAIQNTDAGKYDNVTHVEALSLPPAPFYTSQHYDPQSAKQVSSSPSIYLLLPIGIAAFMLACVAKSLYRQANRWKLFANTFISEAPDSFEESSALIKGRSTDLGRRSI